MARFKHTSGTVVCRKFRIAEEISKGLYNNMTPQGDTHNTNEASPLFSIPLFHDLDWGSIINSRNTNAREARMRNIQVE